MNLIEHLAYQIPMIIASVGLMIAAILKAGKEKGAILIMVGAGGMCVLMIATPVFYSGILPKIIDNLGSYNRSNIYMVVRVVVNILWAVPILLIALGTFMRPAVAANPKPYHAYQDQPDIPPKR